ncbi:MAG TPA: MBOAT family protein [Casimicrobiaceae bacterium]
MVFASPLFLFLFLPATLLAYFALPRSWHNGVLLFASVFFYAWGEAKYLPLVLGSVAFNWWMGLHITQARDTEARKRRLAFAVAANLGALVIFKYANFAVANVNAIAPIFALGPIALDAIPLPLGISFFTFHAISYVVDVYKGNANAQARIPTFALYILLFPQLIAGPIIRFRDIAAQLDRHPSRLADFAYGVRRFALGLGKKVLIANTVGATADRIFALPETDLTTPLAWLGIVCYTLQIYFDFSGYSDMAIGLMRMFGFRILENFNYPYISRSVREFWRRWHISLSNWFRDYLYVPLGGNRRGARRGYVNLVIVFLLCGLWHGASWPFVLWGAWHGVFLVLERMRTGRAFERHRWLGHVYAMTIVMGGWVLFRCETLAHARNYYVALLGMANADSVRQPLAQYFDALLATTLLIGVVFATPLARTIGAWRDRTSDASLRGSIVIAADLMWLALVLAASAATLAAGTYNPFIYFRF